MQLTSPYNRQPNAPPNQLDSPDLDTQINPATNNHNKEKGIKLTLAFGNLVKERMPGIQRTPRRGTMKRIQRVMIDALIIQV